MKSRTSAWLALPSLLLTLLMAAVLLVGAVGWLALAGEPTVQRPPAPTVTEVTRARALLQQHDPRRTLPGTLRTATLSEADLNLMLSRAASPAMGGQAIARISAGAVTVHASRPLRGLPWRRWVNVEAEFQTTQAWPRLSRLQIGRMSVPAAPARWALQLGLDRWQGGAIGRAAADMLRTVSATPGSLSVAYVWQPAAAERLLGGFTPPIEAERLRVYSARLAELASAAGEPWAEAPLTELLPPLFALAQSRSAEPDEAAREHRALLLALAVHSVGRNLGSVVPQARAWERPMPIRITLAGRDDFAQHFLISAFLAVEAGGPLSDAVGTYKELADARNGSGFSFNDIAADRAGSRFGQLAARQPALLQVRVGVGLREDDLMPDVSDLPEFISEKAFLQRYGTVEAPAYRAMLDDIERRLATVRVLR